MSNAPERFAERFAERPVPKPGILDISPYTPGKSSVASGIKPVKLSANESPFGASPAAVKAYQEQASQLASYPDGSARLLREAIAKQFGLNPEALVCGAGSDELLQLLAHAYLGQGDEAIYSQYGFMVYPIAISSNGAKAVVAPETGYRSSVDAILASVTPRTKMVFLANPNNPTGTYLPFDEVKRLQAGLPGHVVLVLDAAYAEYVQRNDYSAGLELVATCENVVMTRTFSKIYGLAGLRLGWLYGPAHIVDVLNRIRGPFNISSNAIAAGVAAIADQGFIAQAVAHNALWLEKLTAALSAIGIQVTPSVGNFLLLHFPLEKNKNAAAADDFLQQRGLILRRMESYHLPQCLRLSVGTTEANEAVIAALTEFMR